MIVPQERFLFEDKGQASSAHGSRALDKGLEKKRSERLLQQIGIKRS